MPKSQEDVAEEIYSKIIKACKNPERAEKMRAAFKEGGKEALRELIKSKLEKDEKWAAAPADFKMGVRDKLQAMGLGERMRELLDVEGK